MAATGGFSTFGKEFCWPSRTKGIIGTGLKFAGYVPHYKILTGNIFGLILKNKMAATGVSLSVMVCESSSGVVRFDLGPLLQGQMRIAKLKSACISLIIGPRGLGWQTNL